MFTRVHRMWKSTRCEDHPHIKCSKYYIKKRFKRTFQTKRVSSVYTAQNLAPILHASDWSLLLQLILLFACACDMRLKLTIENFSVSWNRTHREAMRLLTALLMRPLILITIHRSPLSLSLTHTHTYTHSLYRLADEATNSHCHTQVLSLTHTVSL